MLTDQLVDLLHFTVEIEQPPFGLLPVGGGRELIEYRVVGRRVSVAGEIGR